MLERPYATVDDVTRETKSSDSELTVLYEDAITAASRWIDEYCDTDFWYHVFGESSSGSSGSSDPVDAWVVPSGLILDYEVCMPWPVISLTDIEVNGEPVAEDDYWFENGKKIIYFESKLHWQSKRRGPTIKVMGAFGYPLDLENPDTTPPPTLPSSVKRACVLIAAAWSGELHKVQMGLDGSRLEMLDNRIPSEAKTLLSVFRLRGRRAF